MKFQRVSERNPTGNGPPEQPGNRNAVAGVKARNGAKKTGSNKRTDGRDRADRPALASALVAILDSHGCVCGVFPGRSAARSYLRRGAA